MCSWCWGFSPVLNKIIKKYSNAAPTRLVVGGLHAFDTDPMSDEYKARIKHHWEQVAEATGQPFNYAFFDREGFVLDTEPACRASVVVRLVDAGSVGHQVRHDHLVTLEGGDPERSGSVGHGLVDVAHEAGFSGWGTSITVSRLVQIDRPHSVLVKRAGEGAVSALAWSADGQHLALGTESGYVGRIGLSDWRAPT